jgi:tetratricopeptide (TPR) repeat protein
VLTLGVIASTLLYFRANDERQRVQIEADALQAALRDEPELYARLAAEAIRRHRLSLGADNLAFARYLANHVAILGLSNNPPERQEWLSEALRIIERALDRGDVAAVEVFLVLADPSDDTIDQKSITRLASKALELLQKQGDKNNRVSRELLADLSERGFVTTDTEVESLARQIVALRSETPPSESMKLLKARENLADILARKASAQRRRGDPSGAVPVFREALALLNDVGGNARAYTHARLLELQSELGVCLSEIGNFDEAEPLLINAYRELLKSEGRRSSATESVGRRLIDFYEKRGLPDKAAALRKVRGPIALADAWDMGPVKLPPAYSGWDERLSTLRNQRSEWLLWKDNGVVGQGWLDEASLASAQPRIIAIEGQSVPLEAPRSIVVDPVGRRTLVFHSRTERTVLSVSPDGSQGSLTFAPDDPNWGAASLAVGNYLYTYACRRVEGWLEMECLLGRVPFDRALDRAAWSYYAGSGLWSSSLKDAKPAIRLEENPRFSIHWNAFLKKYMAICTRGLDHRIRIRLADRPEGPWSQEGEFEIEGLVAADRLHFGWIRSSTGHPELARANGRVEYLSYARSTTAGYEIRLVRLEFD